MPLTLTGDSTHKNHLAPTDIQVGGIICPGAGQLILLFLNSEIIVFNLFCPRGSYACVSSDLDFCKCGSYKG